MLLNLLKVSRKQFLTKVSGLLTSELWVEKL